MTQFWDDVPHIKIRIGHSLAMTDGNQQMALHWWLTFFYTVYCITDLVDFSARLSACSGMPYTNSKPGKEKSSPTELGPAAINNAV